MPRLPGTAPQIMIVDDHDLTRRTVRRLLEMNHQWVVCGEASNGQEAVETAERLQPDLIVMDFSMPHMDGLHAAERISKVAPRARVLLFTMHHSRELTRQTEIVGVWGVVNKQSAGRDLPEAVDTVLHGAKYFRRRKEDTD